MNQRHYSTDQFALQQGTSALKKSTKRLRDAGSTSKILQSTTRYCQEEVLIGDYTYKPSDQIGAGYSSRVYKAYGKNKQEYAIKIIEIKRFSASGLEMLDKEIEILRKLNHPNIIKLHHVHKTQTHTYLVTELCKHGDLQSFISRKGNLSEEIAGTIMSEVIEGVKYLIRMGVIHRDLKPANILKGQKKWKIADFGFSILSSEQIRTKQNVGTPLYMPIEALLKNRYSPESDIFAIGVMYFELMVGVTPWQCRTEKELIKKMESVPFIIPEKYRISSPIGYLLEKMCSIQVQNRMKKEEFCQLNIKNFISLHNFNDPLTISYDFGLLVSKKELSSSKKIKKSKTRILSKEKLLKQKVNQQYKIGRKTSSDKLELRKKSFTGNSEKSSKTKTTLSSQLPSQDSNVDRFDIMNEKILNHQLDQCRFIYYLIKNINYLPLPNKQIKKITLIIFKHLIKLKKELVDSKVNYLKLPNWDSFKQLGKYKKFYTTVQQYSQKYEKEYLRHLKESDISVIKQVNQKFSQFGGTELLSLSFYRRLQGSIASALKETMTSLITLITQEGISSSTLKQNTLATQTLLHYYRWLEENVNFFEKSSHFINFEIIIVKNYSKKEVSRQQMLDICSEIKQI